MTVKSQAQIWTSLTIPDFMLFANSVNSLFFILLSSTFFKNDLKSKDSTAMILELLTVVKTRDQIQEIVKLKFLINLKSSKKFDLK